MPEFVDWGTLTNPGVVLTRACELLNRGEHVVFPTEIGYALAVDGRSFQAPPSAVGCWTLGMPERLEPAEWAGALSPEVRRLMRRTWPGPVCFEFPNASRTLSALSLSQAAWQCLTPSGTLALRQPAHSAILDVLDALGRPLVLAESSDATPETVARLSADAALVLEDSGPRLQGPLSRIRVENGTWSVDQPDAAADFRRLCARMLLFVCTGNTCRSPMAEAICKRLLADRLGCGIDELPDRGWWVVSAGVSAYPGDEAAAEARTAVQRLNADLSSHRSRPLRPDLYLAADHVIVMTRGHLLAVKARFGDGDPVPRLLDESADLDDPVGQSQDIYDACAQTIHRHLERLLAEVTTS